MGTDNITPKIAPLVDEYKAVIAARGRTAQHVRDTDGRIRRVLNAAGITVAVELAESPVQRALGSLMSIKGTRPLSLGSRQHHWRAIKSFSRWLAGNRGIFAIDPLRELAGYNPELDPRHRRHIWTAAELCSLVEATRRAETHYDVTGTERAGLYRFLAETSLRPGTVRRLCRSHARLQRVGPHVMIPATAIKNRKAKAHPLRADTARWLRKYLLECPGEMTDVLFPMPPPQRQAIVLRLDLTVADLPAVDDDGGHYDLYSLRHTALTHMAIHGLPMPILQTIAGHRSIELTARYYIHVVDAHLLNAINALPPLFKIAG